MSFTPAKSLESWLEHISSLGTAEIELGLERVNTVWQRLAYSKPAPLVVTVAGTNGKGSTVAMLECLLLGAGYSVGVYTSPHIVRYNERVRINGLEASDDCLCSGFAMVEAARGDTPLSYFEFGTLAALASIAQSEPDVAILEVGLGGRLDAVNIVDADLMAITSIGLDHQDWLGATVDAIGYEKAGIMRSQKPVVLGQDMPTSVLEHAEAVGATVYGYGVAFGYLQDTGMCWLSDGQEKVSFPNSGSTLPLNNRLIVLQLFSLIHDVVDLTAAFSLISGLKVPGRLESPVDYPNVYMDVGHNPHAAAYLAGVLDSMKSGGLRVHAVYSALIDKDAFGVAQALSSVVDHWYLCQLEVERAMPLATLKESVSACSKSVSTFGDFERALNEALEASENRDVVLIFGSFYVVESAKAVFSKL